jgi:hypothetical protein
VLVTVVMAGVLAVVIAVALEVAGDDARGAAALLDFNFVLVVAADEVAVEVCCTADLLAGAAFAAVVRVRAPVCAPEVCATLTAWGEALAGLAVDSTIVAATEASPAVPATPAVSTRTRRRMVG